MLLQIENYGNLLNKQYQNIKLLNRMNDHLNNL